MKAAIRRVQKPPPKPHAQIKAKKKLCPVKRKAKRSKMADSVQEKMDAHIAWLEAEIADCEKKSFGNHHKGKAYLEVLKTSLAQFQRLRSR